MKSYAQKSSAVRAAKKAHGEDFEIITNVDGTFSFQTATPVAPEPAPALLKQIETIQFLSEQEAAIALKAEKKAEIESRKPAFIPAAPIHSAVAEIPEPPQAQALPAFLIPSPPAELAVPKITQALVSAAAEAIEQFGEDELERFAEEQRQKADRLANAQAANVDPIKPRVSTCDKPTKKVWHIADEMLKAVGNDIRKLSRKAVQEECVRQNIAYGTARTQFQHWFKTYNDSQATPIATIGKDGKIVPPAK